MGTFDHIHVYASDVASTMHFYKEVFRAEEIGALPNSFGGLNHLLIIGGQYIAISEFPTGMSPRAPARRLDGALDVGFGIAHFGFNVEDLDEVLERARGQGCEIHGDPRTNAPLRYVYFTAPDGVVIELTQYILPPKLRIAGAAMRSLNGAIHMVRRFVGRKMLAAAQRR